MSQDYKSAAKDIGNVLMNFMMGKNLYEEAYANQGNYMTANNIAAATQREQQVQQL